ncbi:hypothetical protein LCGC14_0434230 [marine sediment metagenome]|uniref:Uncharacterized protein n=1 Tax=marine sediment metagenome TaxID=412755 RepID=A0A0F9VWH3_9ZZZZ|nr:hypothetical protein [Pricia sp.]
MSEAKTARELIEEVIVIISPPIDQIGVSSVGLLKEALTALDAEQKIVICTGCGRTANWFDEDDFGSLGSESGICCHDCGKEEFLTIKELRTKLLIAEQTTIRYASDGIQALTMNWDDKEKIKDIQAVKKVLDEALSAEQTLAALSIEQKIVEETAANLLCYMIDNHEGEPLFEQQLQDIGIRFLKSKYNQALKKGSE